jgi:structural maintenance of chromosome 4
LIGIFGRLGDLGAIDQKYDVAISTATGSGLDTILVDNVDTAKQCIVYLRETNIGRANFLALDKTFHWKSKMAAPPQGFPENVPRLFDLVKPQDNKFLSAFYHSMRDTLVAEDQEQARRIAFGAKRYRVVSLGGEVRAIYSRKNFGKF